MIKYIDKPEERLTVAILANTKFDVVHKIEQVTCVTHFVAWNEKYLMPNNFKVVLRCDPKDTYSIEEGHARAKKILLDNYHASFEKRMNVFKEDMKQLVKACDERI